MAKTGRKNQSSGETPKKAAPARKKKAATKHETPAKKKSKQKKAPLKVKPMPLKDPMGWRQTLFKKGSSSETKKYIQDMENALVPYTIGGNDSKKKRKNERFWPSALFHNATYPRGILVDKTATDQAYFDPAIQGYAPDVNEQGLRSLPFLSEMEAKLWCHKHAAHTSVARRFPVEVGRLVGTITLEVEEKAVKGAKGKLKTDSTALVPDTVREIEKRQRAKNDKTPTPLVLLRLQQTRDPNSVRKITHKQAGGEVDIERQQQQQSKTATGTDTINDNRLARVHQVQEQWKAIQSSKPHAETFDKQDGSFSHGQNDDNHVTLRALKTWLERGQKAGTLVDLHENETKELYGGLTRVPVDATDVLDALISLADPKESLYGIPLVTAYPRTERFPSKKKGTVAVWKIQMGIYIHRLLPEIFCCQSLHTVMTALDEGSYQITQPLQIPPSGPEVFKSAPYPKVDTSMLEGESGTENKSKKRKQDEVEVIDVDDMEEGSRDEMILSPFSARGLLKLLENKGCDVSNWPQLQQQLQGKFRLDLLLHQQHAICWMVRMEHLKGFGINSLLWEERTFADGGKYYYSPALGQIRLGAPPPHMKGGINCDEQGMGKTVEVLGLIMATLPELKTQARRRRNGEEFEGEFYFDPEGDIEKEEKITHSTLIIVPPALVGQWLHEIEKAVGKTTLSVCFLAAQSGDIKQCLPPPDNSQSDNPDESSEEGGPVAKKAANEEKQWNMLKSADVLVTTYDALEKSKALKKLQDVTSWGRIVLDEMQEIASPTTKVAKNCESLKCDRRWMLSGTPIYSGIRDLSGELSFLRLEPFASNLSDGFFDFAVQEPWEAKEPSAVATLQILCLVALRRSKDMTVADTGVGLLDLKPLTVEFVPVAQTVNERALYCWMEYIVASELEQTSNNEAKQTTDKKSRAQCLRLLRELCITPMLINGGLGASSQLGAVNKLLEKHNRREIEGGAAKSMTPADDESAVRRGGDTAPVMSCDQALRFLTQHQEAARTDKEFVTDVAVGGGRGASKRDRAVDSAEQRIDEANEEIVLAEKALATATKKRAKARWHGLLEKVTTGRLSNGKTHKFSALWHWRRLVFAATQVKNGKGKALPELLTRGWRPPSKFSSILFDSNPSFCWCRPCTVLLTNLPRECTQKEVATAMRTAALQVPLQIVEKEKCEQRLDKEKESTRKDKDTKVKELEEKLGKINHRISTLTPIDEKVQQPTVVKVKERKHVKGIWKAYVLYEEEDDFDMAMSVFGRSAGAPLPCAKPVPHVEALAKSANEQVQQIQAEFTVHPSSENKRRLHDARKELAAVASGLRVVSAASRITLPAMSAEVQNEAGTDYSMVLAAKAVGALRSTTPRYASTLDFATDETVRESSTEIYKSMTIIEKRKKDLKKFARAVTTQVSEKTAELSAFGVLTALIEGEIEKTMCPICLGYLGEDDDDVASPGRKRKHKTVPITMLKCGHFYCTSCVSGYVNDRASTGQRVNCPSCRQAFSNKDLIRVDHNLKDEQEAREKERQAAKDLVKEAGKLLSESNGLLDAELWRALYLSFDLPSNVSRCGHGKHTAIPREALAHLRGATGMPVECKRGDCPAPGSIKGAGRCSKVRRLLEDIACIIPKERCVIFSSSKECLMHLSTVFQEEKIGFQAIFTGQSTASLRSAVTKWEQPIDPLPFPCLLVQAGAAAAGLTLTAASKMFLMEPFQKQEQENQAYARCHRYSQRHKVCVKVYYTPVSVESRLLDWRRKGATAGLDKENDVAMRSAAATGNTQVIIHEIDESDDDSVQGLDSSEEASDDEGGDKKREAEEDHDIAQTNFLLGLLK